MVTSATTYTCGDVEVDRGARVIYVCGRRQLLTYGEFEVLLRLVESRGRALTREELQTSDAGQTPASVRAVDTLVARLRRKLHDTRLFQIETVQRIGYRCHWLPSSDRILGDETPQMDDSAALAAGQNSVPV